MNQSPPKLSYLHNPGQEPLRSITIGQFFEKNVKKFGNNLAIISRHQNKKLTFCQVLEEANSLGAGLKAIGLEKGDRLALWAPNQIEWIITNFACARTGIILVTINPAYQPAELEYCLNKVGAKAVICADKFKTQDFYKHLLALAPELEKCEAGALKSAKVPNLKSVIILSKQKRPGTFTYKEIFTFADQSSINEIKATQHLVHPNDPCYIQFTSGTTGQPKAACGSHFHYVNSTYFFGKRMELNKKAHKICVQIPLFHAFGIIAITMALNFGNTLVLPDSGYNPEKTLDTIKEENCTVLLGTPTMFFDLINLQKKRKEDISPEIALCAGAACPQPLYEEMIAYGATETSGAVFQSLENDDHEKRIKTSGYISEHVEAKVVDANNKIVPFGTAGELCIRGYVNILKYWEDEENTKKLIDPEGWLRTGDQFILMENGYGKMFGRVKEMINRGGENIFPKEIEDFLITHPNILEIYVIGIAHERLGEEVCACVRLNSNSTLTQQELIEFCKGKIAHFKIPSKLVIMKDFPKTSTRKIQKFKLKEIVEKNQRNSNII